MNENKFSNTLLWMRFMQRKDPNFLANLLGQQNFDAITNRKKAELSGLTDDAYSDALANIVWRMMKELSEQPIDSDTRRFAKNMLEHLKRSWKQAQHDEVERSKFENKKERKGKTGKQPKQKVDDNEEGKPEDYQEEEKVEDQSSAYQEEGKPY